MAGAGGADLFARASDAWRQGRPEAAAALLRQLLEAEPGHVTALNTLAMIALNRGEAAAAIPYLERAAAAEPGSAPLWFNLYQAFDQAGDAPRGARQPRSRADRRSQLPARHIDEGGFARPAGPIGRVGGALPRDPRLGTRRGGAARAGAPGL